MGWKVRLASFVRAHIKRWSSVCKRRLLHMFIETSSFTSHETCSDVCIRARRETS